MLWFEKYIMKEGGIKLEKSDEFSKEKMKLKKVLYLAKNQLEETQIVYHNLERNTVDEFSLVAMRKNVCNKD